jgi:glycine/D-amino acid oxidase-like deaminating enzyme
MARLEAVCERRQHSPTVALVDQGPAPPGQAARVLASLPAAYAEDLLLRKFTHLNPRLRRPKNVSNLIDAARRPALDKVAHLWIADRRAESTGKVRPRDGERTLPQS